MVNIAEKLDIKCTVRDKSSITVIEAAELIYKTLLAPIADGADTVKTEFEPEGSMLDVYFDILWHEESVYQGTVNDIHDAESRGTKCSKIMYVTRDNIARCVYIFN